MTDEQATQDEQTYEANTQQELHDELARRGLPVSGTKGEQIARLEADDENSDDSEQVEVTPVDVENPAEVGDQAHVEQGAATADGEQPAPLDVLNDGAGEGRGGVEDGMVTTGATTNPPD